MELLKTYIRASGNDYIVRIDRIWESKLANLYWLTKRIEGIVSVTHITIQTHKHKSYRHCFRINLYTLDQYQDASLDEFELYLPKKVTADINRIPPSNGLDTIPFLLIEKMKTHFDELTFV